MATKLLRRQGLGSFFEWALEHYEVRWLTFWCPSGRMHPERAEQLAKALKVPVELVASIQGRSYSHSFNKCDGIDWEEHAAGRPWIWVEDDLPQGELQILAGRNCLDRWFRCNVTEDETALMRLHERLRKQVDEQAARTRMAG